MAAGQLIGDYAIDRVVSTPSGEVLIFENTTQSAACVADLNGDCVANAADLATLLGAWGTPAADLNEDGTTNAADIAILLGAWGACA